jgi:hypothetical protein
MQAVLAVAFHAPTAAQRPGVLHVQARGHQPVTSPFDLVLSALTQLMLRMQPRCAKRSSLTTDQPIGGDALTSVLPRTDKQQ